MAVPGTMGRILLVDLSNGQITVETPSDEVYLHMSLTCLYVCVCTVLCCVVCVCALCASSLASSLQNAHMSFNLDQIVDSDEEDEDDASSSSDVSTSCASADCDIGGDMEF